MLKKELVPITHNLFPKIDVEEHLLNCSMRTALLEHN
jgi:hypothetical protein